jgi:hypothetical protein
VNEFLRLYEAADAGDDGYPENWHSIDGGLGIKHIVRAGAGDRCQRCGHPFIVGSGMGEWSPCDLACTHGAPLRWAGITRAWNTFDGPTADDLLRCTAGQLVEEGLHVEAKWRILTVHHLNEVKLDCRWWNLAALCQRCHLQIQRKVKMGKPWPWDHTPWFQPHAAGWYAVKFNGEELTREQTMERLDELLALGRVAEAVERMPL